MALIKEHFISYDDYLKLKENSKAEPKYIDADIYKLSFPSLKHQLVLSSFHLELGLYLKSKSFKLVISPTKIHLNSDYVKEESIIIPDLAVIPSNNLDWNNYHGVPTLIVEILDTSNQTHDLVTKFNLYMKHRVSEYWIINPFKKAITVYALNKDNLYEQTDIKVDQGLVNSTVFNDFSVNLKDIFNI